MVNHRISTFPWIIVIVVILVLAQSVNCKAHRDSRSQLHQRSHYHRRKPHTKFHRHNHHHHHQNHHHPSMNTFPRSIKTNDSNSPSNITTLLRSANYSLNESRIFLLPDVNLTSNPKIESLFISPWNKTNLFGPSKNHSSFDLYDTFKNPSKKDFKLEVTTNVSNVWNSSAEFHRTFPSIQIDNVSHGFSTVERLQDSTSLSTSSTSPSPSRHVVDNKETTDNFSSFENRIKINDDSASRPTNVTNELIAVRILEGSKIKEYEKMYTKAVEENATELASVANNSRSNESESLETVTGQAISSARNNASTRNRQTSIKELQALLGPAEESRNFTDIVETPSVVLIRKKRSSENGEEKKIELRTLLDFNGPNMSEESLEDFSSNVHKRVKRNDPLNRGENPYALDPNYLQNLEDSFALSALEVQAQKSDEEQARKSKHLQNASQSLDNELKFKRDANNDRCERNIDNVPAINENSKNSDRQEMEEKNVSVDSSTSSPDDLAKHDKFTRNKDLSEMNNSKVTLIPLNGSESNEKIRENKKDDELLNEQESVADIEHSEGHNGAVSRNLFGDVSSNLIGDFQPVSVVPPLVRVKRFGNGSVGPGPLGPRYRNEQPDSSKMALESYANDNKVIDSILEKMNSEIVEKGRYDSLRNKRDTESLTKSKRRLGRSRRRKIKKKRGRKKKKKKHRSRMKDYKRSAPLLSKQKYQEEAAQYKRDWAKDQQYNFHEVDDQDVMSPRDGRRRRDDEDEADDSLHYNVEQPALGQVLRKLRESDDYRKNLSVDDRRRNAEERDEIIDGKTNREKRRTRNDADANGTSQISDKNLIGPKIDEPIRDIKDLIQKLLVKVSS
ncbi:uncharacterized protein [Venturia canescens]|uniref:uncharacterized protein n=1 Tax=Venturia canescens TaxID=32260 RepID=UPI001C9BF035|nr:uncharacterized protein LOC122416986 [Venturia canescens]